MTLDPHDEGADAAGRTLLIVGLGPGDPSLLGPAATVALAGAARIWTDAPGHPALTRLAPNTRVEALTSPALSPEAHSGDGIIALLGDPRIDAPALLADLRRLAADAGADLVVLPAPAWLPEALAALGDGADEPSSCSWQLASAADLASAHHPAIDPGRPALIDLTGADTSISQLREVLAVAYPRSHPVKLAAWTPDGPRLEAMRLGDLAARPPATAVGGARLLWLPAQPHGHSWLDLAEVVAHLRAPEGCPWDREQTRQSLRPYLLEEAYEAVDALDGGDAAAFADELGDLLLQVVLHAQVAVEAGEFALRDVLAAITTKLVRRHPHVFGDARADTADEVLANWEALKGAERAAKGAAEGTAARGPLDGVPRAMPSLARAQLVLRKAVRIPELAAALPPSDGSRLQALVERLRQEPGEATLGEALWHLAAWSQALGLDAEEALRRRTGEVARPGAPSGSEVDP